MGQDITSYLAGQSISELRLCSAVILLFVSPYKCDTEHCLSTFSHVVSLV